MHYYLIQRGLHAAETRINSAPIVPFARMKAANQGEAYPGSCSMKNFFSDLTFFYCDDWEVKSPKMGLRWTSGGWGLSIVSSSLVGLRYFVLLVCLKKPPSPPLRSTGTNIHFCVKNIFHLVQNMPLRTFFW